MMTAIPWTNIAPPLLFVVLFGAYAVYRWSTMAKGLESGIRVFLDRTGFRLVGAVGPEPEASVQAWLKAYRLQRSTGRYAVSMARVINDQRIVHEAQMVPRDDDATVIDVSASWTLTTALPATRFHIAERSFGGTMTDCADAVAGRSREFRPRYSVAITTGDSELDRRFQIWGVDPAGVATALQDPQLKQALLAIPEVDLEVGEQGVYFSDPFQKNLLSKMGGAAGVVALGGNMGKTLELSVEIHDRIGNLMVLAHRNTSQVRSADSRR